MSEKLRAEWFWTDRWFSSSAMALPLEARGLYREMLTRSWAMGAKLPGKADSIRRLTITTKEEWERCWPLIETYWKRHEDGHSIYNETQREVYNDALRRHEKNSARAKRAADVRWGNAEDDAPSNAPSNAPSMEQAMLKQCPPSPSPSPSQTPSPDGNDISSSPSARTHPDGKPPGDRVEGYSQVFLLFWKHYPRKVGKAAAFRSWKTHRGKDHAERILAAVAEQKRSKKWVEGFIPNPATWLNQHRWEDEPDEKVRAPMSGQPQNGRESQLREMAQSTNEQMRRHALAALKAEGFDR